MTETEHPRKTVVLAADHTAAMHLAEDLGLHPRERIIASRPGLLGGVILREGDYVVVAGSIPLGTWEALQHRLIMADLAIAGSGELVRFP